MKSQAWPKIRKVTKNQKPAFLVDARIDGKGERRFFPTKQEAEGFAQVCKVRRKNEGQKAMVDDELGRYGWTVKQAIDFALAHLRAKAASKPLPDAIEELVLTKDKAGKSTRYQNDLKNRLRRLVEFFPAKTIGEITTADLDTFLAALSVAPGTRNTFRRDIRTLWSFAEKRGWAFAVTAKNTERASLTESTPGILTPQQAAALLIHSQGNATLTAYHAIGLFAGLRTSEIQSLDWKDVDLVRNHITVAAANSKTRRRRLVPILPNLAAWLAPLTKASGPVVDCELRTAHENARTAAGITPWPTNAMRHSFVSYRLAATGNAAQTALEAGHDQAVLFAHYRELVRPDQGELFFSILPTTPASVTYITAAA